MSITRLQNPCGAFNEATKLLHHETKALLSVLADVVDVTSAHQCTTRAMLISVGLLGLWYNNFRKRAIKRQAQVGHLTCLD